MKKMASTKSHSWWWESHVSPKNSKWLAENQEEMDKSVKRMLKLIEGDADSFAEKAEMYYEQRPELVSLVEEFCRMYRSLAERYDQVTVELRKNVPAELQSQGSSDLSADGSRPSSRSKKSRRPKSMHRAAGYDFFLGSGGSTTERSRKSNDSSSSSSGSGSDSDVSDESVRKILFGSPGNGNEEDMHSRMASLESELMAVSEKLMVTEEDARKAKLEIDEVRLETEARKSEYSTSVRKLEEEVERLRAELEEARREVKERRAEVDVQAARAAELQGLVAERNCESSEAAKKFSAEKSKLEKELQLLLNSRAALEDDFGRWVSKAELLESEIASLKKDRSDLETLYETVKAENSARVSRIEGMNRELDEAKQRQDSLVAEKNGLEARVLELLALVNVTRENAIAEAAGKFSSEKSCAEKELNELLKSQDVLQAELERLRSKGEFLESEISCLRAEKSEMESLFETSKAENSSKEVRLDEMNRELGQMKARCDGLISEKDALELGVRKLMDSARSLSSEKSALERELSDLRLSREDLEKEFEESKQKVESLQSEMLSLKAEKSAALYQFELLQAEKNELEARVLEMTDSASKLTSEKYVLERELSDLRASREVLDIEICKLKLETQSLESELSRLRAEISAAKNRFEAVQAEKLAVEGRLKEVTRELDEARAEHHRLVSDKSTFEARINTLEDEVANSSAERSRIMDELTELSRAQSTLGAELRQSLSKAESLEADLSRLETEKSDLEAQYEVVRVADSEKGKRLEAANRDLDGWKLRYDMLVAERDTLQARISDLVLKSENAESRIRDMDNRLNDLHVEHARLIAGAASDGQRIRESEARAASLEEEVDRLKVVVSEGAEAKREVIRQLCFSLDHLQGSYNELRRALHQNKRTVLAS